LQEGQNWEAIMYASAKKVDNLIATVDLNGNKSMEQPMKLLWEVSVPNLRLLIGIIDIEEGNNIEAIISGMTDAKSEPEKGNLFVYYILK
jgi:transketolase